MLKFLKDLWKDEDGATAIEYGLLVGLIAAVIIVVLTAIGVSLNGLFGKVNTGLANAG